MPNDAPQEIDWRKVIDRLSAEAEADEAAAEALAKRARSRARLMGALVSHLDRQESAQHVDRSTNG